MDAPTDPDLTSRRDVFLARVAALLPAMRAAAAGLDREAAYPGAEMRQLHRAGALLAPLPTRQGGLGLGTEADAAIALLRLLRQLGSGNPAVGRLFEGHVNAVKLVATYGRADQLDRLAADAAGGHAVGLWVTDDPTDPVLFDGTGLRGSKSICSGAGHVDRALVTVTDGNDDTRMAVVTLGAGEVATPSSRGFSGMRAATSGRVCFDGVPANAVELIGEPGDYLRQPHFSAGAWRTSAVTLGLLDALLDEARRQLMARGRHGNPHQLVRMGEAYVLRETAALWLGRAASLAEAEAADPDRVVAYANLARIAVERACLDTMERVQRSLGLAAFSTTNVVERMCRDLATYLRQPAPDETLTEAAAYCLQHDMADWS